MLRIKSLLAAGVLLAAVGCGGSTEQPKAPVNDSGRKATGGVAVDKAAAEGFDVALREFADIDQKGGWNDATCKQIASQFQAVSKTQKAATNKALAEAQYNAGLAYLRCGMEKEGREAFQSAVDVDAKFFRAKAQLALLDYQKSNNVDSAIAALEQIIRDAQFQVVEALVAVAALQMERGNDQPNSDGKDDLERAKKNLQRALAIDDGYMPAFNQLAIYYLEQARLKSAKDAGTKQSKRRSMVVAGLKGAQVNEQMLDLAALVASQAVRKNPKYAPIHNTSGLIQVELRNFNGAVKSFAAARALDKDFFEAHMNYAAVNLSFRGFEEAERSYREALRLKPNEFEAHLGLALAIRGQINMGNKDKLLPGAEKELAEAKKLQPNRAETYYNEAILTQEFKAKGVPDEKQSIAMMRTAIKQYQDFIGKASAEAGFADAVKRSKDRIQDLEDTIKFLEEGAKVRDEAAKNPPSPPPPPAAEAPPAADKKP